MRKLTFVAALGLLMAALFTVIGLAQDGPLTALTNLRGRTDASGYLLVDVATGGSNGNKTANAAVPGATNVGALGCIANAAIPSLTEAYLQGCSVDLHGAQRVILQNADGTSSLLSDSAASTYFLTSAASTNATSVKASPGQVYSIAAVNTTATLYYLRMYNLATAPTCSSATGFVNTFPIPASTTGAGLVVPINVGAGFTTGVAFCLTGGGSSTDNTNAATGVYLTAYYR